MSIKCHVEIITRYNNQQHQQQHMAANGYYNCNLVSSGSPGIFGDTHIQRQLQSNPDCKPPPQEFSKFIIENRLCKKEGVPQLYTVPPPPPAVIILQRV